MQIFTLMIRTVIRENSGLKKCLDYIFHLNKLISLIDFRRLEWEGYIAIIEYMRKHFIIVTGKPMYSIEKIAALAENSELDVIG